MNLYLEGYSDAISGHGYDTRYASCREYNRGWSDAVRDAT